MRDTDDEESMDRALALPKIRSVVLWHFVIRIECWSEASISMMEPGLS